MKKISICIPTYNRLESLLKLLEQIKSVKSNSVEIIVCDDSTNDITKNYFVNNSLPNIKYYKNPKNLGQFKNCNACITRSDGDWVHIVHDDDTLDINYIEQVFDILNSDEVVMITGRTEFNGQNAELIKLKHEEKLRKIGIEFPNIYDGMNLIPSLVINGNPFVFSHTIFRKKAAIKVGGFNELLKYVGDYDLWLKLLHLGKLQTVDFNFGKYNIHSSNYSITKEASWDLFVESFYLNILYTELIKNTQSSDVFKKYFEKINNTKNKALFISKKVLRREEFYQTLLNEMRKSNLTRSFTDLWGFMFFLPQKITKLIMKAK